jgi:glycosyltransferase involved in cell wall biosynthesis
MSDESRPNDEANLRRRLAGLRVVHVLTVAESLRFLRGQLSFMRGLGIDLHVICGDGPEVAVTRERECVQVITMPLARAIDPMRDLAIVARLVRMIRALRADLVHGHTPKGGLLGMMAAMAARTPARVYHMRGLPFRTAHGARRRLLMETERTSCGLAHRVIANSASLRAVALGAGLVPADKITVLGGGSGNGVDVGHYDVTRWHTHGQQLRASHGIPTDSVVVGYVGRFAADKGFDELMQAWIRLRRTEPRAHLVLVGDVDARDPVRPSTMEALDTDARVTRIAWVPDAAPWYAAMDLVVLPSHREGFPNVLLEAAAMSLPVVTTDAEGCRDAVVAGVTGALVPIGDAVRLADALAEYVSNGSARRAHGNAGRARCAAEFSQPALWRSLAHAYVETLDVARRRTSRCDAEARS